MIPRPEYPRPQFRRKLWWNLNGEWEFRFDDGNQGIREKWYKGGEFDGKIVVPFAYQSRLSGIGESAFHDIVWYRRSFVLPKEMEGKKIFLRFGAVDYEAKVWLNGEFAGSHEGGHTPFSLDVTHLVQSGSNEVTVRAEDRSEALDQPRGKQYWKERPESIFYTRTTGIWQTVWLEAVHETHLRRVRFTPDLDRDGIHIEYWVEGSRSGDELEIDIRFRGEPVAWERIVLLRPKSGRFIRLHDFPVHDGGRLWSPEHPNLYDVTFRIRRDGILLDEVESYFGMRKISVRDGKVFLNNRPYYMKLVLDQGYFPDGILTAPSDEWFRRDIELAKAMGFNGARKHQKIEDPRYLFWADRLGFLVWEEMPNAYCFSDDTVRRMMSEWREAVERDYNHPSVVVWVPVNESWGVPELQEDSRQVHHLLALYHLTKSLDSTRPVISNDGWEHVRSDLFTVHDYEPDKGKLKQRYGSLEKLLPSTPGHRLLFAPGHGYGGEPVMVTEFGGIAFRMTEQEGWGYSGAADEKDFIRRYGAVVSAMLESPLIAGFCYTQLTDVEQEINGLLTYDRKPKVDTEIIRLINEGKVPSGEMPEA